MPFAATAPEPRRGLIALRMAIFVARRKAMRRLKLLDAMSSATSCALVDMLFTSTMFTSTVLAGHLGELSLDLLHSQRPDVPMTMPGFAQWMVTRMRGLLVALSIVRSISILGTPAL